MQGAFCDIIRGLSAHSNPKARMNMHRHKFLRHAAAVLAAAALLVAVVLAGLAGLAAALPDTLYTDGPAAELEIARCPT